jgi:DNA polymerase (family 10)
VAIHNAEVAAVFEEIADLLEIDGANPFRIRAYRNAARTLQALGVDISTLIAEQEDLTLLSGIGKDLAGKIIEIVETGHCQILDRLRKANPPGLTELLKIPGLGPKRISALFHELDIHTTEQLYRAAKDGIIRTLPGFGEKTEARLLEAIETQVQRTQRFKLATAAQYAEPLAQYLRGIEGVKDVVIAGSYRRCKETVGDIDILVSAPPSSPVMTSFVAYDEIKQVTSQGPTRSSVILKNDLQIDLRLVEPHSFGAALHYFTGSKAHNIAIRRRGLQFGLKINEYGVFVGYRRIAGATENSVFKAVGLPYIAPELRENRGEIEAALQDLLPQLIELKDLKGDLHTHAFTNGSNGLKEMALAAKSFGFEYLAVTDHFKHFPVPHGIDQRGLLKQMDEIDRLNEQLEGFTLLKGIEIDILENGQLDLADEVLAKLDIVVGAVHSKFDLSRQKQTQRILKAMDQPYFTMLAHPTGRLLQHREPYDADMPRIIRHAKQRGCFLELNAHPDRLDLMDIYAQMAKEEGVLISINSDARSKPDFDNLRFGIGQARRGWLEKKDVLNTRPLSALRKLLKASRR